MNRKRIATALVVAAIAGAGYIFKHGEISAKLANFRAAPSADPVTIQADAAPIISVVKAEQADFQETVLVSGSLVPREEVLVAPEIEGLRVLELFADEGSKVTKGQVLARLVSEQLDAQMAQNDASLARSTASIAQAQSQIVQAESRAKESKAQLDRAEPLKKSGPRRSG